MQRSPNQHANPDRRNIQKPAPPVNRGSAVKKIRRPSKRPLQRHRVRSGHAWRHRHPAARTRRQKKTDSAPPSHRRAPMPLSRFTPRGQPSRSAPHQPLGIKDRTDRHRRARCTHPEPPAPGDRMLIPVRAPLLRHPRRAPQQRGREQLSTPAIQAHRCRTSRYHRDTVYPGKPTRTTQTSPGKFSTASGMLRQARQLHPLPPQIPCKYGPSRRSTASERKSFGQMAKNVPRPKTSKSCSIWPIS